MSDQTASNKGEPTIRRVAHWLVLVVGIIFGGTFFVGGAFSMMQDPALYRIALEHFPAAIGLPAAALAAMCIVVFLESSSGPIEFEGFGFHFKGASGPIILWVVVFLAITAAIKVLY
ncbi:hypothetical protein ACFPTO_03870 [Paraburkholderia denitrificans]|uniref:Uncharacterized protein n=1 Tax=Paraburkholderia denitrificans TaxID=694025 RepID=A0ABW0J4H9_9BURK